MSPADEFAELADARASLAFLQAKLDHLREASETELRGLIEIGIMTGEIPALPGEELT